MAESRRREARRGGGRPTDTQKTIWLYLERRLPEALIDAWVVVEQVLDRWWQDYLDTLQDKRRVKRLKDVRAYTSAVRLEFLRSVDQIDADLYELLDTARDRRNKLAHRGQIDVGAAKTCMVAMQAVIERATGETVANPFLVDVVSW